MADIDDADANTHMLPNTPLVPGSIEISIGDDLILTDDGSGGLTKDSSSTSTITLETLDNSIDYDTGSLSIHLATAPSPAASVTINYEYNKQSEDFDVTGNGITAEETMAGGRRTAQQVADELNANASFARFAEASVFEIKGKNHLLIEGKFESSTASIVVNTADDYCSNVLGIPEGSYGSEARDLETRRADLLNSLDEVVSNLRFLNESITTYRGINLIELTGASDVDKNKSGFLTPRNNRAS